MLLLGLSCWLSAGAVASTYHVSSQGADTNDGRSPERAWRTVARVNAEALKPGDTVLFRRGDSWREHLVPRSGAEGAPVTYGAYGNGAKPLFLGSIKRMDPQEWRDEGNGLWVTGAPPEGSGATVLREGTLPWGLYCENGAQAAGQKDTTDYDSAPESLRVECVNSGKSGSDLQLTLAPFTIKRDQGYRLTFRAKCTQPFGLAMPVLMKADRPWTGYAGGGGGVKDCGPDWQTYTRYYQANTDAPDARFTFFLGGALPAGAVLHVDSLTLVECDAKNVIPVDVGNIIFDGGASCGFKKWTEADLHTQGDFWYDADRMSLKLYSAECPARHYRDIEFALSRHLVDQSGRSYVTYEGLAFWYAGAHGIGGGSTHHITVRGCDFAFIGGADQLGGGKRVRFGNGIEFWGAAHDNLVEGCRLWEIYDAALTNQNAGATVEEYNLYYRNNVIWNSEYSFEYWNDPASSVTHDVYFENNTCVGAGHGWSHRQRPDPSGRHLCFYDSAAQAQGLYIRNNIFDEAATNALYAPGWTPEGLAALQLDHNCWRQAAGVMILLKGKPYTMAQFAQYQAEQGKEPHSIVADPLFVNAAAHDFHLAANSPCVDAGVDVGLKTDCEGTPIPQGKAPDIGAYEWRRR